MHVLVLCALGLKWGFWSISPLIWEQYQRDPKTALPCAETRHMAYTSLKSVYTDASWARKTAILHYSQWAVSAPA